MMRRWEVREHGGPDKLELVSVDTMPVPGRGQVLLRVLATTATYTDLLVLAGHYRPQPPLPITPGYECIADVAAVGEGVTHLAVGDRVASMPQSGCAATHRVTDASICVPISRAVAPLDAVNMVLTGVTAFQMLHRATEGRITRPGASILVHGCVGGTGAMVVALAKISGIPADRIFGTCSARNIAVAERELGIRAFDYALANWDVRTREASGGEGVDVVFDHVMGGGYMAKSLRCLRRGGKLIGYGLTNTARPGTFSLCEAMGLLSSIAMRRSLWSCFDGKQVEFYNVASRRATKFDEFAADTRTLVSLLEAGTLRPLVGHVWSFEEVPSALRGIASNTHTGKQVIRVADV